MMISTGRSTLDDDLDDVQILDDEESDVDPTADNEEEDAEDDPGLPVDSAAELLDLFDDPDEVDDDL
jgi:hypothetical protein